MTPISYVAGSLNNSQVIVGEPVYFELTVSNSSLSEVFLDSNTTLSFSGSSNFSAHLLTPTTLPASAQALLKFEVVMLSTALLPSNVVLVLDMSGQDAAGTDFAQSLAISDPITVLANDVGVVEVPSTLQPTEPSRRSMVVFWVRLKNTTDCPIRLGSESEVVLKDEHQWLQRTPLYREITIQPGEVVRVEFGTLNQYGRVSSYIRDDIPDGTYNPLFRLFGERTCDGAPFNAMIDSTQAITQNPLTGDVGGLGTSGGSIPAFTQEGGVIELNVSTGTTSDPYQILVHAQLGEATNCDGVSCKGLPLDKAYLEAEFVYLHGGPSLAITNLVIESTPDMVSDVPWLIYTTMLRMTRQPGGGIGITSGVRADVRATISQRNGLLEVENVIPENTFVQRGETFHVRVAARNLDAGDPNYPIHPDESSQLLLTSNESDISSLFSQALRNPGIAIHQQNQQDLLFDLSPTADTLTGKIVLGTRMSSYGVYPYYEGHYFADFAGEPYLGPKMVTIANSAVFPAENDRSFVYVVEDIPLVLKDNLLVAIGSQLRELPLEILNTSSWNFTIGPESMVELALPPRQSMVVDTVGGLKTRPMPSCRTDWAQSFVPDKTFDLNDIDFAVNYSNIDYGVLSGDIAYSVEIIPANADGSLPTSADMDVAPVNSIGTVTGIIPEETWESLYQLPLKTPPIDVRLEEGRTYYAIFRFDTPICMFGTYDDDGEAYPYGRSYVRMFSNRMMRWIPIYWRFRSEVTRESFDIPGAAVADNAVSFGNESSC